MIFSLTDSEYEADLQVISHRLTIELIGDGIRETFFTKRLPLRHIISPCQAILEDNVVSIILEMMSTIRDPGLYVDFLGKTSYTNRKGELRTTPSSYYYVPVNKVKYALDEGIAKDFMDTESPMLFVDQYKLYSAKSKWVIDVNPEAKYALLGMTQELAGLDLKISQLSRPIEEFLQLWKPDAPFLTATLDLEQYYSWIPRMLIHVYGRERATHLLHEAGFLLED